jgi:hypothetical protein
MANDDWAALSPMLEVIDRGHCTPAHPTPLLVVHGAWDAAWCWDEHFLNFFADKGYRALAASLRQQVEELAGCAAIALTEGVGEVRIVVQVRDGAREILLTSHPELLVHVDLLGDMAHGLN